MTRTAKLDITKAEERGLTMGLNEFSGYVGVAIAGILTAYAAEALVGGRPTRIFRRTGGRFQRDTLRQRPTDPAGRVNRPARIPLRPGRRWRRFLPKILRALQVWLSSPKRGFRFPDSHLSPPTAPLTPSPVCFLIATRCSVAITFGTGFA